MLINGSYIFKLLLAGIVMFLIAMQRVAFSNELDRQLAQNTGLNAFQPLPLFDHMNDSDDEQTKVSNEIRLNLRTSALVDRSFIFLSDVATCESLDSTCEEASGIIITNSPKPGNTISLSKQQIEDVIAKEWKSVKSSLNGANQIQVKADARDLNLELIKHQLTEILESFHDTQDHLRANIKRLQIPSKPLVRPGSYTIEFEELTSENLESETWVNENLIGYKTLNASVVYPESGERQEIQVQATFELKRRMPVATHNLHSGEIIGNDDVVDSWVIAKRGFNDLVVSTKALYGKKIRTVVQKDQPFQYRSIEAQQVVARGQTVKLIMKNDDFELTGKGKTVDGGALGQIVEVINLQNKKRIRAKILDQDSVEVVAF